MELTEKIIREKNRRLTAMKDAASRPGILEAEHEERKMYYGKKREYWQGNLITPTRLRIIYKHLGPYEIVVYHGLAIHADVEGHCWPSMRTLAKELHLDKDTVNRCILSLREKGFIKIKKTRGKGGARFEYWLLK